MSGLKAKAEELVAKVTHPHGHSGSASTNAGPHDSNLANKADPTVDSDLDGSRNAGATSGARTHQGTSGLTGNTSGVSGVTGASGSTNTGPHNSNLANKADPRVDSDRDGSHLGSGHTGTGYTGTSHTGSTNAGPHNSNLLNKADPRVDSDRDGSHFGSSNTGTGYTGTGYTGTGTGYTGSTNAGPHNSNLANKADPRVDSDRDGSHLGAGNTGLTGGTTHSAVSGTGLAGAPGTGPAPNTAGPHKSDMLNKMDPRVDADLDGSKTYGGNKTYTS